MNGLFGNFGRGVGGYQMPQMQTPQQNVSNYLRMPVIAAPQQQQYPSVGQFVQMFQPKQENAFESNPAIRHIAGLPPIQQQSSPPSQTEQMLMTISGYNGNTTS